MEQDVNRFLDALKPHLKSAANPEKIKESQAVVGFAKEFLKVSRGKDTDLSYFFRGMLKYLLESETDERLRAELWGINGGTTKEGGYFLHPTEVLHPKDNSGRPVPVLGDGRSRTLTAMGHCAMEELAKNIKNKGNLHRLVVAIWETNKKNLPRVVFDTDADPVRDLLDRMGVED